MLGKIEEGDDRRWDGWMASWTQWTWVWVNSWSWWWIWRPGLLQSMGSQRVRHDWATEQQMVIHLHWCHNSNILNFFQLPRCLNSIESESKVTQLCPTLFDSMDCSPPGCFIHEIFQARILEWVASFFSGGSPWSREPTRVSRTVGRAVWATREAPDPS